VTGHKGTNQPPLPEAGGPAVGQRPPGRHAPSSAQQRLREHVAAARGARRRRAFFVACGTLSSLVLVLAGSAWALSSYVNGTVNRVNAGTAGGGYTGPLNILLAGVDQRKGLTRAQERELHVGRDVTFNSDTMMVIHISADRSRVTVVSLPRDSWVDIPGHGMGKINSAFGLGGPTLMVATVEHDTGLAINHYVEVNFLAFVKVIDALGGVDVCLPQPVNDPYSGLHLSAGRHHVTGITALKYARDRHSFPTSDLARISNQQSLLASLLAEAASSRVLANPLRLNSLLHAVLGAVEVDRGLNVTALAGQLRTVSPGQVRFLTVPLANTGYLSPTGESAVLWDTAKASAIFRKLAADQPLSGPPHRSKRPHHGGHRSGSSAQAAGTGGPPGSRTATQAACG
jgi:LCP family protein required for cell wall assembly